MTSIEHGTGWPEISPVSVSDGGFVLADRASLWHLAPHAWPLRRSCAPWKGPPRAPTQGRMPCRGRSPRRCSRKDRAAMSRAVCIPDSPRGSKRFGSRETPCPNRRGGFRERLAVIGCRSFAGHASCCRNAAVPGSQWLRSTGPGEHRQGVSRTGHRTLHPGDLLARNSLPLEAIGRGFGWRQR